MGDVNQVRLTKAGDGQWMFDITGETSVFRGSVSRTHDGLWDACVVRAGASTYAGTGRDVGDALNHVVRDWQGPDLDPGGTRPASPRPPSRLATARGANKQ